jgi:hypothetical protein
LNEALGEKAARAGRDAGKLADKLQNDVFGGPINPVLQPFIREFETLPDKLRALSRNLAILRISGKAGRKHETMDNLTLAEACELVQFKLGKTYYEDMAELYQAIPRSPRDRVVDFTGDAIRRRIERFRR